MAGLRHPTQAAVGSTEVAGSKKSKNQSIVEVTDRQLKKRSVNVLERSRGCRCGGWGEFCIRMTAVEGEF